MGHKSSEVGGGGENEEKDIPLLPLRVSFIFIQDCSATLQLVDVSGRFLFMFEIEQLMTVIKRRLQPRRKPIPAF